MDEQQHRACERCGAENPAGAGFCWQCLASFVPARVAAPLGSSGAGAIAPPPTPAMPAAPAGYAPGGVRGMPANGPDPMALPPPAREPAIGGFARLAMRVVFSAVGFLVGWFVVDRFMGPDFSIPDSIAGAERVEGKDAEDFQKGVDQLKNTMPGDVDGGLYQSETRPLVFYVIALEAPSGTDYEQDFQDFVTGFQSSAGSAMTVDMESMVTTQEAGVTYVCAPVDAGELESGICMWRGGDVAGVVQAFNQGIDETRTLTARAHDAVLD